MPEGTLKPVMQKAPKPVSEKVGRRTVEKEEPGLLPNPWEGGD
jgi:hypothetical protein